MKKFETLSRLAYLLKPYYYGIGFFEDDKPRFTPEWLHKYLGLEHLRDEEALRHIETLEILVDIFFEFDNNNKG